MAEALETIITFLRWHGIWARTNSVSYGLEDFMNRILALLMIAVVFFLCMMHLYLSIEGDLDQLQPDEILVAVGAAFVFYVYYMFLIRINKIILLVEDIRNYRFGKPPKINELVKKQSKYSKIIYIYTIIGTCLYAIVSYFEMIKCKKMKKSNQFCYCIFPIWLPSDIHNIPYVDYIIVVFETVIALIILLTLTSGNYFAAALTEHITIRVKHLRLMLKQFSKISSEKDKMEHFVNCIKYHVDIIRIINRLTKTFGGMNNVHFLTPIIIGGLNFKVIMILSIKDSINVMGWILSIGILCYNGQELLNECQALAADIYDLKWYSLSPRSRYYIEMVLLRTQIPLKITAGIFYSYSNEFLMMIMRISYTYTTVLTQIFMRRDS